MMLLALTRWRPVVAFAIACGAASMAVSLLRNQGVEFAAATGLTVATGLATFVLASSWLTAWARSQRD